MFKTEFIKSNEDLMSYTIGEYCICDAVVEERKSNLQHYVNDIRYIDW